MMLTLVMTLVIAMMIAMMVAMTIGDDDNGCNDHGDSADEGGNKQQWYRWFTDDYGDGDDDYGDGNNGGNDFSENDDCWW